MLSSFKKTTRLIIINSHGKAKIVQPRNHVLTELQVSVAKIPFAQGRKVYDDFPRMPIFIVYLLTHEI